MHVSADDQISFDLLGAIYAKASPQLRLDIYKSCLLNARLPDAPASSELQLLLEAHLFEPLYFSGNVEKVVISSSDTIDDRMPTALEWLNIQTNASAFAKKHGASLSYID